MTRKQANLNPAHVDNCRMMTKELPKQTYILAKSGITKDQMVTLVLYEPNEKQDHIRS